MVNVDSLSFFGLFGLQDAAGQTPAPAPAGATQAPGTSPAPAPGGSLFTGMAMPLLLCAVVFYLLVLGPERKQRKKREEMLKKLSKGDKVMTTGGMHATVAAVQDDIVTLQIAEGVRARFSRSAVQAVITEEASAPQGAGGKEAEKAVAKR
jgi:preprotein translocase subunit YajC